MVDTGNVTGRKAGGTYRRSVDRPSPTLTTATDRWRVQARDTP